MFSCTLSGLALALALVTPTSASADDIHTVKLAARNGRFYPETLQVPAHTRFKIVIHNQGPGPEEFESSDLKKEKVLAAGATSFLVFAPLAPGVYQFVGEFHLETAKGQIVAK